MDVHDFYSTSADALPKVGFRFSNQLGGIEMKKFVCTPCGYIYDPSVGDPDNGIAAGTAFADIPDGWVCPECGAEKEYFEPEA